MSLRIGWCTCAPDQHIDFSSLSLANLCVGRDDRIFIKAGDGIRDKLHVFVVEHRIIIVQDQRSFAAEIVMGFQLLSKNWIVDLIIDMSMCQLNCLFLPPSSRDKNMPSQKSSLSGDKISDTINYSLRNCLPWTQATICEASSRMERVRKPIFASKKRHNLLEGCRTRGYAGR